MYFSKIVAAFAPIAAAVATLTAPQVVDNINIITGKSQALQSPANQINILSGPLFLVGLGPFPTLVLGFSDIVTTVSADITAMAGTPPFTVLSAENDILTAWTTFIQVHQALLNIIIGKAGLLNDLPLVGPPVAQVLRSLEAVVDTVALGVAAMVPDVSISITAQAGDLHVTIEKAITAYTPAVAV